jgi:heptosyltransferase-1
VRIVLVRLSALGDIVHTWPLAQAIRDAQPEAHLTWVVEQPFRSLVDGHPAVDAVITVATKRWRRHLLSARTRAEISHLRTALHELQPTLAIDSQGVLKSSIITRWTGAPQRVGLARPWRRERLAGFAYTSTLCGSIDDRHVVATNLQLVRSVGGEPPDEVPHPDGSWLLDRMANRELPVPCNDPYAVLVPGAGWASKQLPTDTLARVAHGIAARNLDVLVVWGPDERDRADAVASQGGHRVRLAPPTNINDLALVLSTAALVIGGDTGPVHLAASFGVPTLAVFTATDWQRNGPLGSRVDVISGIATPTGGPKASAHATPVRTVAPDEIVERAVRLLATDGV